MKNREHAEKSGAGSALRECGYAQSDLMELTPAASWLGFQSQEPVYAKLVFDTVEKFQWI